MRNVSIALVTILLLPSVGFAQNRGLAPADYYKETTESEVAVSPDGSLVAFTVTTVVEKENTRHREIWMARLKGGARDGEPFRFTDPTQDSYGARWSPDGTLLAFTSRRGKDPNGIWFARVAAPGGEAHHIPGVTAAPVWSRDGAWIAFTRPPGGDEEEGEETTKNPREGWIAPGAITKTLDAKRFDGRVITAMRYKSDGTLQLLPDPSIRQKSQLFVVPATGGEAKQLTHLPFDVSSPAWTPDGRLLLFTGNDRQDDEYNEEPTSDIYVIARDGGEPRSLTPGPGAERAPAIAPDGSKVAYLFTKDRGSETDVMIVDLGVEAAFQGQPRSLTAAWDLQPGSPEWTANGRALRFDAGISGNQHVFEVSLAGQVRQITQGDRQLASVSRSRDGAVMAYVASTPNAPPEVFAAGADGGGEQRLTSFNDAWTASIQLVPAERLTWKVSDGTAIEGWIIKPLGYRPGNAYPMILKIHGGPHGAYGNAWFDQFQMLSASGFFVLYTNPRGSTGYGHRFTYATKDHWGEVDHEDYLGGVDAALKAHPDIDPRRIGVSGGSYGGYMTCWLTATTDRFAAAATARTIVNWESWYGTSDAQGLTEHEFSGRPWEQRDTYRRLSPLSYVENVTAPTLVLEGENDYRTPIGEGEQWFMSLRKRKVPTELVRYPRSSHGLSRTGEPWLLVDRLERIRTWFVYWLIEHPATTSAVPPGR
jgi:dipeptidyl aminopeptidase/acylaminoacyl peptidase